MDRTHGLDADFRLAQFSLWVHGWESTADGAQWEDNFLDVTARFETSSSFAEVGGYLLLAGTIEDVLSETEALYRTISGTMRFSTLELGFDITVEAFASGQMRMSTEFERESVRYGGFEKHQYMDEIDQSYLKEAISGLRKIAARFPRY